MTARRKDKYEPETSPAWQRLVRQNRQAINTQRNPEQVGLRADREHLASSKKKKKRHRRRNITRTQRHTRTGRPRKDSVRLWSGNRRNECDKSHRDRESTPSQPRKNRLHRETRKRTNASQRTHFWRNTGTTRHECKAKEDGLADKAISELGTPRSTLGRWYKKSGKENASRCRPVPETSFPKTRHCNEQSYRDARAAVIQTYLTTQIRRRLFLRSRDNRAARKCHPNRKDRKMSK